MVDHALEAVVRAVPANSADPWNLLLEVVGECKAPASAIVGDADALLARIVRDCRTFLDRHAAAPDGGPFDVLPALSACAQ